MITTNIFTRKMITLNTLPTDLESPNITKISYDLESSKEINIKNLIFKDTFSSLLLSNYNYKNLTIKERFLIINEIMHDLDSNTGKGYLNTLDLTKFSIVNELLPSFILSSSDADEYLKGNRAMESYKWIYNVLLLNLYILCLETLHNLDSQAEETDLVTDFRVRERELYSRLDPTIRQHLQKRGVSIIQNIYTGFDTEFQSKDISTNTLLSTQLAITTKTYVKIPRTMSYSISSLDVKADLIHPINKSSSILNYKKIETSIQMCIDNIRQIKYGKNDASMYIINECLKNIKGITMYEKEDSTIFSFPRSVTQPYLHIGNSFSFKEIVDLSNNIGIPYLEESYSTLIDLIQNISSKGFSLEFGKEKLFEDIYKNYSDFKSIEELSKLSDNQLPLISSERTESSSLSTEIEFLGMKKLTRRFMDDLLPKGSNETPQKVSVTKIKNNYFIAHLTQADLSLFTDFDLIKEELNIVNGSFVTLGKPFTYAGSNVHIRDTMLLAPAGSRSLSSIGKLYGGAFNKIEITKDEIEDMERFLIENKAKFVEYALRDALIALMHASWMEDFNFKLGGIGIPLSLSSIGRKYVKFIWNEESYSGYQISPKYILGDASATLTPIGLNFIKNIGFVLPYYIANYKGGRNECFMYGVDRETLWYDYDLTSAYTTVMSAAGHPVYSSCRQLNEYELKNMSKDEILYSYIIIKAEFEFNEDVKYPSIPCYVDESCTVYPKKGSCILTGAEYLLAISQNCKLNIHLIYLIPFSDSEKVIRPFQEIIKQVQEKRREFPKGTISNLMYKEIGNSIYGSVVRGISNKRKFDIKTGTTIRIEGDELTNPLIASWTTAFIRSIIGECLHSIDREKGLVVSVTTDGFITNLDNLEDLIKDNYLFSEFKKSRAILSGLNTGLELKSSGKGMIAWTTRGQMGFESKIIASTGFQRLIYNREDLLNVLLHTIESESKTLEYIQSRLRSATEIYKKGGHVTMVYRDQIFRMHFDNRRLIIEPENIQDINEGLLNSKPLLDIDQAKNLRFINKFNKTRLYSKQTSSGSSNIYRNYEDLAIRNFIKGLLVPTPMFNLNRTEFETYNQIIEFIKGYKPEIKITVQSISNLKNRVLKWKTVPRTLKSEAFIKYVKTKFKDFDVDSFFRSR